MSAPDGVAAIAAIDVSALERRTTAHRGRGHRAGRLGFRQGGQAKATRIVVREAGLDRSDEAVHDGLQACRAEQRERKLASLQQQADELAACLVGEGYADVEAVDVSDREGLARRGGLRRIARITAREAGLDRSDDAVRAAMKTCRTAAKAAAGA
jgi:hypothetical protein